VSTAACVALSFSIPNFLIQETFPDRAYARYDMVEEPLEAGIRNGRLAKPTGHGLGVTLNRDFLDRHRIAEIAKP
jgi:L-alanine-DL-glutamate epimerase-like enolase superfamily enzyme